VHYLAPANGTDLTAVGRVLRRGRRLNHGEVSIVDSEGAPIAHALGTYQLG
jgi:acyl-coenzyme A thioesterase PaaI-like protein